MQLKTNVWVNKITSLSEARYCAGMGVQYLGFQPAVIDSKTFQDITGWVMGPSFFLDISEEKVIPPYLSDYDFDYLLIREDQANHFIDKINYKLLIKKIVLFGSTNGMNHSQAFNVVENWTLEDLQKAPNNTIAIVSDTQNLFDIISFPIAGILLEGSREAKPGIMEYDHISSILEMLEEEI